MRTLRIILGILFFIVAGRGIVLLGSTGNGNIYPAVAITAGVSGCLVMIFMKGKHGGE